MSLSQAQYYANAKTIFDWWRMKGRSRNFALGMLAQADAESSLNPLAVGDHGGAFGLHQLHMDRVKLIRDGNKQWPGCHIDVSKLPLIATQLAAVAWELDHSESLARRMIEAATTPYEAGSNACYYYERPGALGQAVKRGMIAQRWGDHFAATA